MSNKEQHPKDLVRAGADTRRRGFLKRLSIFPLAIGALWGAGSVGALDGIVDSAARRAAAASGEPFSGPLGDCGIKTCNSYVCILPFTCGTFTCVSVYRTC